MQPVPRSVPSSGTSPAALKRSVAPSSMTMIAVSPMTRPTPSIAPVTTDGRAAGSSTRRVVAILRLADGVGRLAHMAGDRLQPLADVRDDQRQRDQRQHRRRRRRTSGRRRRRRSSWLRNAERRALEDQRRRRARTRSTATPASISIVDSVEAREPRRAAVLAQPHADAEADREARSPSPSRRRSGSRAAGRGSRRVSRLRDARGGERDEQLGPHVADALDHHVEHDRDGDDAGSRRRGARRTRGRCGR